MWCIVWTLHAAFVVPFITGGTNSLSQSCESEGVCVKHIDENRFSCGMCGEKIENATENDLPAEYYAVCCYRNGIWYSTMVSFGTMSFLHKAIKSLGMSFLQYLSYCFAKYPVMLSRIDSLKAHGGVILPDMSLVSDSNLDEKVEELAFDSNNITTIDNKWFSGYKRLRSLSLTYNQITVIENCSLPVSGTVINFNISNNDLDCCSILYLKHWEALWGKDVVYGECKVNDRLTNFADDFVMQCSDVTGTTTTPDQIEFSQEEFLRTLLLVVLGAALLVATGVTIGTLKLVNGRTQRVSSEYSNKDVDIMKVNKKKEGIQFVERRVGTMIDSFQNSDLDDIDLMTYPSNNNVPPIGHQFTARGFHSAYSNRGPTADHVNYTYIDSLPYTVEGYLDLSRV